MAGSFCLKLTYAEALLLGLLREDGIVGEYVIRCFSSFSWLTFISFFLKLLLKQCLLWFKKYTFLKHNISTDNINLTCSSQQASIIIVHTVWWTLQLDCSC